MGYNPAFCNLLAVVQNFVERRESLGKIRVGIILWGIEILMKIGVGNHVKKIVTELRKIANDSSIQFSSSTIYTWTDNTDKNLKPNKANMTTFKNLT